MVRYAITAGDLRGGGDVEELAAACGRVKADYVLVREKAVEAGLLVEACRAVRAATGTKVLVSGRADVAMAAGIAGVHLSAAAGQLTIEQVRTLMSGAIVSVSCHTLDEVRRARDGGADLILFGPVFEKLGVMGGVGLGLLGEACAVAGGVAVLALGGVGEGNVAECVTVGAAGFAGIRAFFR